MFTYCVLYILYLYENNQINNVYLYDWRMFQCHSCNLTSQKARNCRRFSNPLLLRAMSGRPMCSNRTRTEQDFLVIQVIFPGVPNVTDKLNTRLLFTTLQVFV